MKRQQALNLLLARREAMRQRFGVSRLSLFGSVARDEATDSSDIDVLVEFERPTTLFQLGALQLYLEDAFVGPRVDVVPRDCILPHLEAAILKDAVDVR